MLRRSSVLLCGGLLVDAGSWVGREGERGDRAEEGKYRGEVNAEATIGLSVGDLVDTLPRLSSCLGSG